MKHVFDRLEQLARERIITRLKHLRGQHDQRDHAWNRGMGGGGANGFGKRNGKTDVNMGPNQTGPLPTMQMYRQQQTALMDQYRRGDITRQEMRQQAAQLRGMTTGNPFNNVVLTNQNNQSTINNNDVTLTDNTPSKNTQLNNLQSQLDSLYTQQRELDKEIEDISQKQIDIMNDFVNKEWKMTIDAKENAQIRTAQILLPVAVDELTEAYYKTFNHWLALNAKDKFDDNQKAEEYIKEIENESND